MRQEPFTTEAQRHRETQTTLKQEKKNGLVWSFLCVSVSLWWVLTLTACGKAPPPYQEQGYVFGTLVEVSIHGEGETRAKQAAAGVMQEFQRLHDQLHAWKPSALSELNAAFAKGRALPVGPELEAMLRDAAKLTLAERHL